MTEHQPAFGKTLPAAHGAAGRRGSAESGFWHRPDWMNLVSDVVIVLALVGLSFAAVKAVLRLPVFSLQELVVTSSLNRVTRAQIEYAANSSMRGNFFTVDLEGARKAFENLPWVRRAQLLRRWPGAIEVFLEEHEAVAYWRSTDSGDTRLVNSHGEMFDAASNADMPVFSGPADAGLVMIERRKYFDALLKPMGRRVLALTLSGRQAWQLKLDDGMILELGTDEDKASLERRLSRFVAAWPQLQERAGKKIAVADLRYPSGFAVRMMDGEQRKGVQ
ncbi:MAG: cell division protein FtsQ/DivIB [Uliginosibacterium sp.]|nr:cell division protein FtsQ/DivIB [Uliginosibacterium sp.]MBK9394529.1 cell division protein FtsQ/DivIB [Uliginosibacterium sp.]MBK9616417.1 cell division protein FtsQ/DivIB [Uliginosibacterium sp.]